MNRSLHASAPGDRRITRAADPPAAAVPPPASTGGERGFVLVGVVMFVLALTILGISLFSLSGYEAQFMGASYHKSQTFYDAMSGIERTKFILAAGRSMFEVQTNYPDGVIYASAVRNGDSTGTLSFSDTSAVRIRVVAERMGERTMLEANYVPQSDRSLYHDLIATTGQIAVHHDDTDYETDNIFGCGSIRNSDFSEWSGKILPTLGGSLDYLGGGVPTPEAQDFISAWQSSSSEPTYHKDPHSYRFDLQGNPQRIFKGPSDSHSGFRLWDNDDNEMTFDITGGTGTAVWLLPAGAYFEQPVTVTGAASNNLIIVASKGTNSTFSDTTGARLGLWFEGGISSDGPRLFLVSDGTVALDRWRATSHENSIPFLALFSGGVYVRGPKGGPGYVRTFQMTHCAGNDDAILDPLYDAGLLPNTLGRTRSFALVPGSFQEITDSNPPY